MVSHLRFFEDNPESLKEAPEEGIRKFLRGLRREVSKYIDDGEGQAEFNEKASYLDVLGTVTTASTLARQKPGRAARLLEQENRSFRPWLADLVADSDSDYSEFQRVLETDPTAPTPVIVDSTPGTPRVSTTIEEQDALDEARYQARQQVRFVSPEPALGDTEDIDLPDRESPQRSPPTQSVEERDSSPDVPAINRRKAPIEDRDQLGFIPELWKLKSDEEKRDIFHRLNRLRQHSPSDERDIQIANSWDLAGGDAGLERLEREFEEGRGY